MESNAHQQLKRLSLAFLREHGCLAVATEVRCPISRYRVDAAGYLERARHPGVGEVKPKPPQNGKHWKPPEKAPATVIIECKQSRADFLRERHDQRALLDRRQQLDRLRRAIQIQRIMLEEPHLRQQGQSLFPELDVWDFPRSRNQAYQKVLRQLRRIDQMLHGQTKFCMIARYALADRLYIAAPEGMIKKRELPPGWGLLECPRKVLKDPDPNADLFGESVLKITITSPRHTAQRQRRERMLRNIAVSASAALSQSLGILAGSRG